MLTDTLTTAIAHSSISNLKQPDQLFQWHANGPNQYSNSPTTVALECLEYPPLIRPGTTTSNACLNSISRFSDLAFRYPKQQT